MKSNKKAPPKQTVIPAAPAQPAAAWNWQFPAICLGLLVAMFQLYGPALYGPFVFDDMYLPFAVPGLAEKASFLDWIRGNRPMLMFSYWLNYKTTGNDPYFYKAVNIVLHLLTSLLVMMSIRGVLRKTEQDQNTVTWLSRFGGAVFLLHPLQTETVGYVASRSDGLSVFFFYAAFALFLYRLTEAIGGIDSFLVLVPFGLACLTKEHAAVLPLLLVLTDYYFTTPYSLRGAEKNWRLYAPIVVFGAIGVAIIFQFILGRSDSAGFGMRDLTWYQYFFTEWRALVFYILLFILPGGQNLDYDFPISRSVLDQGAIGFLLILLALIYAAWRYRKEYPLASYGFFAYLILMAPTSSIVPIKDPFVERRVYLSMFGLILIAIEFLRRLKITRQSLAIALSVLLVAYASATWNRSKVYASSVALWSDVVSKSPNKARPHLQLGYALQYELGSCEAAVKEYAQAAKIEQPDYRALVDSALASDCAGDTDDAIRRLQKAITLEHSAHAFSQLGMMYAKQTKANEAFNALSEAERLDPNYDMTYAYRGNIYLALGDLPKAIEQFQRSLSLNPTNQLARMGLERAQNPSQPAGR